MFLTIFSFAIPKEGSVHPSFGMTTTQDIRDLFKVCIEFECQARSAAYHNIGWSFCKCCIGHAFPGRANLCKFSFIVDFFLSWNLAHAIMLLNFCSHVCPMLGRVNFYTYSRSKIFSAFSSLTHQGTYKLLCIWDCIRNSSNLPWQVLYNFQVLKNMPKIDESKKRKKEEELPEPSVSSGSRSKKAKLEVGLATDYMSETWCLCIVNRWIV